MSPTARRFRSLVVTIVAVAVVNVAIALAAGAKSAVPTLPDVPKPNFG